MVVEVSFGIFDRWGGIVQKSRQSLLSRHALASNPVFQDGKSFGNPPRERNHQVMHPGVGQHMLSHFRHRHDRRARKGVSLPHRAFHKPSNSNSLDQVHTANRAF